MAVNMSNNELTKLFEILSIDWYWKNEKKNEIKWVSKEQIMISLFSLLDKRLTSSERPSIPSWKQNKARR